LLLALAAGCSKTSGESGGESSSGGTGDGTDTGGDDGDGGGGDDGGGDDGDGGGDDGDGGTGDGGTGDGGTDDEGTGTDDGAFIAEPDGGVEGQCDPMAQDCPDGEKCTAYGSVEGSPWDANKCVPATGDGQVGDPCDIEGGKYTGIDNCAVGFICLLTDNDGFGGVCVEFCNTNQECPESDGNCAIYNDGSLPICLITCDPLLQDCPEGQGCYNSAGDDFVCYKYSGEGGEGAPGDECNYVNQCQPGTICLAPDSVEGCGAEAGCCSPYCDLDEPNPSEGCNPTEECTPYFEEGAAPPGLENLGVCAIPA